MNRRPRVSGPLLKKAIADRQAEGQRLIVRVSFVGGPMDRMQATIEIPAKLHGRLIQFDQAGYLYRSATPFKGQSAMALLLAAEPISSRPVQAPAPLTAQVLTDLARPLASAVRLDGGGRSA